MKLNLIVLAIVGFAISAAVGGTSNLHVAGWAMSNNTHMTDPSKRSALYAALSDNGVDFVYICGGKANDVFESSSYGFVKCATALQSTSYVQMVLGYDSSKYEFLASTDSEKTGAEAYLYSNAMVSMGLYLRDSTTKETMFVLALVGTMDMNKSQYQNWLAWVKSDIEANYPTEKILIVLPISKTNANLGTYLVDTWGLSKLYYDSTVTDFALFGSPGIFTQPSATTVSNEDVSSNSAGLISVTHTPKCVVTFKDYDGTVLKVASVDQGGSVTAPEDPTRDGFTFTGWGRAPEDFQNLAAGFTVVAQYAAVGNSHIVRFVDEDGSTLISESAVSDGMTASAPESLPLHEGRHFMYWTKEGSAYDMSSPVTNDIVLVAHYEANVYEVTFVDWNGARIGDVQLIEHGGAAVAPAIPDLPAGKCFWKWDVGFSEVTATMTVTALVVDALREIGTYEEFAAAIVDGAPPGTVYMLTSDINLETWIPVDFAGTLDGCGHTIEGLGNPLFNTVSGGRVENLVVASSTVASEANDLSIGFIARTLESGAVVSNCTIAADARLRAGNNVKGGAIAGCVQTGDGYAGEQFVGIFDCTNHATIEKTAGDTSTTKGGVGGIVGYLTVSLPVECAITRCFNDGAVLSANAASNAACNLGGIVGYVSCTASSGVLSFEDCRNDGTINCSASGASDTATATRVGGIVGAFAANCSGETRVTRCVNRGSVSSGVEPEGAAFDKKCAGGLAGYLDSLSQNGGFVVADSANYGAVSGNRAGGMVAQMGANLNYAGTYVVISNVANYGEVSGVTASAQCVGQATVPSAAHVRVLVNSFFGGKASLFGDSTTANDYAASASGVVTAGDEGYDATAARKLLDAFAAENGNERWVLGRVGDVVFPELACFLTKAANIGMCVIVR